MYEFPIYYKHSLLVICGCWYQLTHDCNLYDVVTWCEQLHCSNSLGQLRLK